MGADTEADRQRGLGDVETPAEAVRREEPSPEKLVRRNREMGENTELHSGTRGNGADSSSTQRINSTTAEDNSPAVSVSEFISLAARSLYEDTAIRNAHANSDKESFALEVETVANSYYTRLITERESSEYSVEQLAPLYNRFQQDMEGYGAAPQSTPFTSSNSSFVSQDMIDCVLRCGSSEPHSLERIISQYQKNKGIDSNADFLRKEFGTNARGIDFGQTTGSPYNRITAWYDENGITIGLGSKVQNNYAKASVTWEQAAERIEQLLGEGKYAEQVVIDDAEAYTRKTIADNLWYLHQDISEGVEYFIPDYFFKGGFPESTEKISEALQGKKPVSEFIDGLTDLMKRYETDSSIMRFNFHKMPEILESLKDLQLERREFRAEKNFEFAPVFFISEEEKDLLIIEGSGVQGGKFRIEDYFSKPHSSKEKADFLKDEYGIGGSGRSGYDTWHDAKGLVLRKGGFGGSEAVVSMKWSEVADRITRLLAQKKYITDKDIESRIRDARWYIKNSDNEQQIEQANGRHKA